MTALLVSNCDATVPYDISHTFCEFFFNLSGLPVSAPLMQLFSATCLNTCHCSFNVPTAVRLCFQIVDFGKFLVDVLEVDPIRRPTADQLLQHSWLQDAA
jgi:hypothetical protein